MVLDLQPTLENDLVILKPLKATDFEELYATANDPAIWAGHPNKNRWQREIFQTFFEGAMRSGGAFLIIDRQTAKIIGSTRYYNYDRENRSIFVGYTFYATAYWGKGINPIVKRIMLNHVFPFVDKVQFHVGAENLRSQIAVTRLGAVKVDELEMSYFGEPSRFNYVYELRKSDYFEKLP
ncbi:GNAT family N-acetyltransferase [Sphingobacterium sp. lm-10]|uniref:GNAT family N-acetyltransferase n=1 Tax=Sphingobacterium sp. lm-10 TaxID=2944904 RepID=UPI0020203080|nr:GNAT family N-acetyltransferase [Sphingobacterium sp. lm-10]MCL7988288.1 GNAT family N-acetyltransferase [Sphingobacterium sp. lm-10]